jgi:predicted metal-binding membrane protein
LPEAASDNVDRWAWLGTLSSVGRAALGLLVSLLVLTAGAWAITLYHSVAMSMPMGIVVGGGVSGTGMAGMAMAGMPAGGWSVESAAIFVAIWTVMMTAMMIPAAAPMIVIFASAQARRHRELAVPTWNFVAGYLLVWAAAGVLVYVLVQIGSEIATRLAAPERARWGPPALGGTLLVAGLYQFTSLKRICLTHCRSPLAFVAQHWREGHLGALRMGILHGGYCLGCCWALFAVLVAAGVMSLAWMLMLTLVVFGEKVLPYGGRASAVIGAALIALGILVAAGTLSMPWLS